MAVESTKGKSVKGDKTEPVKTVYAVGRARFPTRKPGVWSLIGVYATDKLAKAACYDKWCAYIKVEQDVPVSLTMALERGKVCFVNEA